MDIEPIVWAAVVFIVIDVLQSAVWSVRAAVHEVSKL